MCRSKLFILGLLLSSVSSLASATSATDGVKVHFCAPENDIYPFFITDGTQLGGINPGIMRQIFADDALQGVSLVFDRRPWKRCNSDLASGKVDVMIGGYEPSRTNIAYPSALDFDLDNSIISTADVCFSSVTGQQMDKLRHSLENEKPFIVGVEAGFTKKHGDNIKPEWVELFNPIEKYRMLESGRVDAIVQICAMDKIPIQTKAEASGYKGFETLYPPYLSNPAYIVFSHDFVKRHMALAKQIILISRNLDKPAIYSSYQSGD